MIETRTEPTSDQHDQHETPAVVTPNRPLPPLLQAAYRLLSSEPRWFSGGELARRLGLTDTRALRAQVIDPLRFRYLIPVHGRPGSDGGYKLIGVTVDEHQHCLALQLSMVRAFIAIYRVLRDEHLDQAGASLLRVLFPRDDSLPGMEQVAAAGREDALDQVIAAGQAAGEKRVCWPDVVMRLLDTMAEHPDRYADDIARIRERHGAMLLDANQIAKLRAAQQQLTDILGPSSN